MNKISLFTLVLSFLGAPFVLANSSETRALQNRVQELESTVNDLKKEKKPRGILKISETEKKLKIEVRCDAKKGGLFYENVLHTPGEFVISEPEQYQDCELKLADIPFEKTPIVVKYYFQDVVGGEFLALSLVREASLEPKLLSKTTIDLSR